MAITKTNTEYNGSVVMFIFKTFFATLGAVQQGVARLETGVRYKTALPQLSVSEYPAGDYSEDFPATDTVALDYLERYLEPKAATVGFKIVPKNWMKIWDKWASTGNLTQLQLNPEFLKDVLALVIDANVRQNDELFWQGSAVHANTKLRTIEGIITRALVDVEVVDIVNQGVITDVNIFDVLTACHAEMASHVRNNPNFVFCMNEDDYLILQNKNTSIKSAFDGLLNDSVKNMFNSKRVIPFHGIPKNTIVSTIGTNGDDSNLVSSFYFTLEDEVTGIDISNDAGSKTKKVRYDYMIDANYNDGSLIGLYRGV